MFRFDFLDEANTLLDDETLGQSNVAAIGEPSDRRQTIPVI